MDVQLAQDRGEFGAAPAGHRDAQRVVQGRLDVDGAQRGGGPERLGGQPVLVHGEGDERDAEAGRDALHHGVGQRFDAEALAGRDQGGDRRGDRLPAVAREEQLPGVRCPVGAGEVGGGGPAGRVRTDGAHRAERGGQGVRAHQMFQALGEERGVVRQDGEVHLQVDPGPARLGQGGLGSGCGGADESAAADLPHREPTSAQFPVHPGRRRTGDAPVPGEPAERQQPVTGAEPAGGDVGREFIGDRAIVVHRSLPTLHRAHFPYCAERLPSIASRSQATAEETPPMGSVFHREITVGYEDEGSGEPLMLVHGHPFNRSMWRPQTEHFSRAGWRVIVPDLRGYGDSTVLPGATPLATFARDLVDLLDHLGIERCVLGGLSMGGQIVMECYRLFPERFRAWCSPTPSPRRRPKTAGPGGTPWRSACSARAWRAMRARCWPRWSPRTRSPPGRTSPRTSWG